MEEIEYVRLPVKKIPHSIADVIAYNMPKGMMAIKFSDGGFICVSFSEDKIEEEIDFIRRVAENVCKKQKKLKEAGCAETKGVSGKETM